MGIAYNTSIVSDGLVFALDAANSRCYSGSGTSTYNLINSLPTNMNSVTYSSSFNGCYTFSGSYMNGGAIDTLRASIDNLSSITVSLWAKRNAADLTYRALFSLAKSTGVNSLLIRFIDNKLQIFCRSSADVSAFTITSEQLFDNSKFYHISTTINLISKETKIYVDGSLIPVTGTTNYSSTIFGPGGFGSITSRIGDEANAGNAPFNGLISQVLVHNRELTAQEILQNYNATKKRYL